MEQLLSFVQLKKLAKHPTDGKGKKLVLMGDCATQHLATAIQGTAMADGLNLTVVDTDYNLLDVLTLDEHSELFENAPDFVVIYMCTEKLLEKFRECSDKSKFAEMTMAQITEYWSRISSKLKTNILMFSFVEKDDAVFGFYGAKQPMSFIFQLKKLNCMLSQSASMTKNTFIIDLNQIALQMGMEQFSDAKLYYSAKMPVSLNALPAIAAHTIKMIQAINGRIKKCIIVDLDNTLWGGVIGDDGLEGIQIGELGIGHAYEALQHWLKDLKERGIILCVCSKNNEDAAKLPFTNHPEMVLHLDDISVFVANWEDKASNIRNIQQTLNIGMDSIVFLDDNPFERNLVRSTIPDITVPELPNDPAQYLDFLQRLDLFETASYSEEDRDRTRQYQAEMQRISQQKQYDSYDEYLQSLNMVAVVAPFDNFQVPRIAQLTQRSNQFNLRTIRCTEDDVVRLMNDKNNITIYFMLSDKFGDHGLISLVILERMDSETLFIHNWLMSCRVLKRGMEAFILNTIVNTAKKNGYKRVIGEYIKTPKNAMVEHIYEQYGFSPIGSNRYIAEVDSYKETRNYIKMKE